MSLSSEFGYMTDEQLLERLESIAYGTIRDIVLDNEESATELTSNEKENLIKGVLALIRDISFEMDEERDKHGAANS